MTKLSKLYSKIVNNPKDVSFEELDKVFKNFGFVCRQPSGGSSHYTYSHKNLPDILRFHEISPLRQYMSKKLY